MHDRLCPAFQQYDEVVTVAHKGAVYARLLKHLIKTMKVDIG
jgi:hypothetical protein